MLGPRPGEVCGLRENSLLAVPCYMIDFERGYDNYECETDLKTGDSHRTPPIPKYLYKIIYKRLLWKREMRLEFTDWGENDYLFVSQNGKPIKPHQYYNGFKRLLNAHNRKMEEYQGEHGKLPAGGKILPDIPLYGLRTSFATNNMRRRPNAALISSIMGNSPKTLIQFYTQSDIEMQQEVINDYVGWERYIVSIRVITKTSSKNFKRVALCKQKAGFRKPETRIKLRKNKERETGLEPATPTLARSYSTN